MFFFKNFPCFDFFDLRSGRSTVASSVRAPWTMPSPCLGGKKEKERGKGIACGVRKRGFSQKGGRRRAHVGSGSEVFFSKKRARMVGRTDTFLIWRVCSGVGRAHGRQPVASIDFCEDCGEKMTLFHALFKGNWAWLLWYEIRKDMGIKVSCLHPAGR